MKLLQIILPSERKVLLEVLKNIFNNDTTEERPSGFLADFFY